MNSSYLVVADGLPVAIADVSAPLDGVPGVPDGAWCVNRVHVMRPYRGRGHGREVMRRLLAAADGEGVALWLTINPYGELTFDDLDAWYRRCGFTTPEEYGGGLYVREPASHATPTP